MKPKLITNSFLHNVDGSISGELVDITESDSFWGFFFIPWAPQACSALGLWTFIKKKSPNTEQKPQNC